MTTEGEIHDLISDFTEDQYADVTEDVSFYASRYWIAGYLRPGTTMLAPPLDHVEGRDENQYPRAMAPSFEDVSSNDMQSDGMRFAPKPEL